jgi:SAM-dependent methyltransferase
MDLADDSIDGIICRWGFMLMIDPEAAMNECRRVLKDDRRIALSVWGRPEQNPWLTVTGMTMTQLGHQPSGDPFGPGGIFSLADHDKIRSMLNEAGFADVTIEDMGVEWNYGSFDEAWEFWTQVAGPVASVVKQLGADDIERLRDALQEAVQPFQTGSSIKLPGVTINATAS